MSEPSNLVPNLIKIMEEYAKGGQEVVQATQAEIGQEEERAKAEQSVEETRKRKRKDVEVRAERREEKASDWASEMTYVAWRDKLQHGDFIGERGFSKWISQL